MLRVMQADVAHAILHEAWREPGFCVPHAGTYPFQWLWDSCFHAVVWAELGDDRATAELASALANQTSSGFVPHLTYWGDPGHHADFWGRRLTSTITQPPMYGHAIAACVRHGVPVDRDVVQRAVAGLRFLLTRRARTESGLVAVVHPWETGCDDSLRWDDWLPGPFTAESWFVAKGELVRALCIDAGGAVSSEVFAVGSAGFNALVAWNVEELATVGEGEDLVPLAEELVTALRRRWDEACLTWTDAPDGSGRRRTLDALLPLIVDPRPEAFDQLVDPAAFGAPFGPRGAHRDEPAYRPDRYWRGSAWPQLTYLLALAAERAGRQDIAAELARCLVRGAERSGVAEYWHPETGEGYGARPQTWTTLALVLSRWSS